MKRIPYILYWLLVGSLAILAVILYFYSSDAFLYTSLLMIAMILIKTYDQSIHDRPHLKK